MEVTNCFNIVFCINYFIWYKIGKMKNIFSLLFIILVTFSACSSKATKEAKEKDSYEKAKESLEEREKKNPMAFLKVSSRDKHNLIGQTVIKGTVSNSAKVCIYKDVDLEISYFSKTGVLLSKNNEMVFELIEPGKSVSFKTKDFAPKGTDSIAIKIMSAKVK